jgi:diadenosine tetraphosphate (Ap4A) HIT family hydrolase
MSLPSTCPFCAPDPSRVVAAHEHAVALRDGYPVSPGHTLIVPRRHVASLVDLSAEEWAAIGTLLRVARAALDATLAPQGYNVGVNDGPAAGQTVMHLHVHLIPRYHGDVTDPRGGVRWVLPAKADYWSSGRGPDET